MSQEVVDDWDKVASIDVGASSRRSTLSFRGQEETAT
jgi:hypothetical protein